MTQPHGDHPYTDPGDGRTECQPCGKWIWPAIHSCRRVPVTPAARQRAGLLEEERHVPDPSTDNTTRLLVEVTWNGNYYLPHEREGLLRDWIESALSDRDDSPGVRITNLDPNSGQVDRRTHAAALQRALDVVVEAALRLDKAPVSGDQSPDRSTP